LGIELHQFSLDTKELVTNHGKITEQYGDLFIFGEHLERNEKKVFMKFNNIYKKTYHDKFLLEQKIKLTEEHLANPDKTLFGEFSWADQGWGGQKGGMKIRLNNKSMFYSQPGSCYHDPTRQGFSFKFSDFEAKVGDEIEFHFWVGGANGHQLLIWDLH